jgi:tetratricopeptide (TPR) repeat protein
MHRWDRSRGRVGVNAPSWLTFEVHRPYLDGGQSPLTAVQARGPAVAGRLFEQRQPLAPRFGMVMPASYRQLLTEESRLAEYRVRVPADLPGPLRTPAWSLLVQAFEDRDRLDDVDRAGLAQWLVAACLPAAALQLAPSDVDAAACADPLVAQVQYARAMALFQAEGRTECTTAAFRTLVDHPAPTVAHMQAAAAWGGLLARHASDDSTAPGYDRLADELHEQVVPGLPPFDRVIWRVRALRRGIRYAERHGDYAGAWRRLSSASIELAGASPATAEQQAVALELRRQLIDRQVEIAVRLGDAAAEAALIADGLAIDPYCVKLRMQAAQAVERRGDLDAALDGYLLAARLGPFGTGFALLAAARVARTLGRAEPARVFAERAFRAAPRSRQTSEALLAACAEAGDEPLARAVRLAASGGSAGSAGSAGAGDGHRNNWHYQAYGAYFNLDESHSPCFYARLPLAAYEEALDGIRFRVGAQRIMPPAFKTNLVKESGLAAFGVAHPADLPASLRTPAWDRLCEWVAGFSAADLLHRHLVGRVLFRLGFRRLVLDLVPPQPVASLQAPLEFVHQNWREIVQYAAAAGSKQPPPTRSYEMVDHPDCPLHLKLTICIRAVVFVGRETKSVEDAVSWRKRARTYLDEVLDSNEYTPFEKTMWHSRFYRGVSFAPFLARDRARVVADMDLSEELARSVPVTSAREAFLKAENLHACLESRSKEAFNLGDVALGVRRTEEFLALDPYDPKSHIEMAEALARQGSYRDAGDSYLRAARLGPLGTAIAYSMAGECFDRAGDSTLARDCFVQALRVDPYSISGARGWRRVADGDTLAREYADTLEEWGTARNGLPPSTTITG